MKYLLQCIIIFTVLSPVCAQPSNESLRLEALTNISKGKYGEAIELLNRFISANPQNPEGFNLRGTSFEKRGLYEQAVYDYRSALKLDPNNLEYKSNLSRTTEEFRKILYNTIAGYKREIAINPSKAGNYLEVGKSYKKLGEWFESEKWYDDYLRKEEASADEILRYTEILAKNKHISKGESILKRYTQKYPEDHRLWSRYGYFTMWLGKKKTALKAFEKALQLRPYFKEAMDGYDLVRGKGYVYTVNDTTSRYNYGIPLPKKYKKYPIDKYYSILKKRSGDNATRYLLIDELVKNNRYEEAKQQLDILSLTQSGISNFQNLELEVLEKQDSFYKNKIHNLENKLSSNSYDKKTILELSKYYSFRKEYSRTIDLFDIYLMQHPDDNEIRYQKSVMLSRAGNLNAARNEMEKLVKKSPRNNDYQLFYSQLLVWMNEEPGIAEANLNEVLSRNPGNINALITMAHLNFQKNDLASARTYLKKGLKIDPLNKDFLQLEKSIELQAKRNKDAAVFRLLEQARENIFNKNCDEAINYYKMYFDKPLGDPYLKKELAEAYLCNNNFSDAIKIYNELILEYPDDYELNKQLAKIYYWSGDSLAALYRFEKLSLLDPNDAEAKLFLGDSYFQVRDYKNARKVYEELLVISPSSHILQTRMNWLGSEGIDGYSALAFPTHFSIIPDGNYFNDNLDFTYTTQGARLELGVTSYLSLLINGYVGSVSSDLTRINLNIIRAGGYLKFSKLVSGSVNFGVTNFEDHQSSNIFEASIRAKKEKKYDFSASFSSADAVQLLYSPFLVDLRLTAHYTILTGEYITNDKILLGADFRYISVSDNNRGNKLILRLGKIFEEVFGVGYEYYYYNFNEEVFLYWSPNNFVSHSAWADWDAVIEDDFLLNLKGKIGLVPNDNFIVREFHGNLSYKFAHNFMLQSRYSFGSSVRYNQGYNSVSFGLTLFWTF
jgi:Flp pilus assembly protein TadD